MPRNGIKYRKSQKWTVNQTKTEFEHMLQYQEGYQIQVHRTITYPLVQIKRLFMADFQWNRCLLQRVQQIYDWYTISSKLCNLKRVVCISDLIYGFSCLTIHRSISAHYEAIWKIELSRYRNYRQQHFKNKREVEREIERKKERFMNIWLGRVVRKVNSRKIQSDDARTTYDKINVRATANWIVKKSTE